MIDSRRPADALAFSTMLLLCVVWGFQQVTIKWAIVAVPPVLQGGLRSALALALLVVWARWRGLRLLASDGVHASGLLVGAMFSLEFVFIYAGLGLTDASRMVVFIYLAPCLTALGLAWKVPGERLDARQWAGVVIAFAGMVVAFAEGFFSAARATLLGDLFGVIGAALWAATTVTLRVTPLGRATATRALFYQLAVSALVLTAASFAMGERAVGPLTWGAAASIAYQGVVVAFASYLAWFWLLTRYLATRIAVFSFLTPLFGVAFGVWLLGEPISLAFAAAVVLVVAGIGLVNLPRRALS